jgi:hypothetical protein
VVIRGARDVGDDEITNREGHAVNGTGGVLPCGTILNE